MKNSSSKVNWKKWSESLILILPEYVEYSTEFMKILSINVFDSGLVDWCIYGANKLDKNVDWKC